jgi:hypothetical protein
VVKLQDVLTGPLCSVQPPAELYQKIESSSHAQIEPEIQSLRGMDDFYEAYREKLRPLVDQRYPDVQRFRKELVAAFVGANDFLAHAFGGGTGFGHRERQLPAEVEWFILSGESKGYSGVPEVPEAKYSDEEILQLGRTMARAHFKILGPEDVDAVDKRLVPILKKAISHLRLAEQHLNDPAVRYYRAKLMRFLAECL